MTRHAPTADPTPVITPARERSGPLTDRLRGLLALLVIVALLIGLPAVLYALQGNPLPHSSTDLSGLPARLAAPDTDGSLFLGALTWIGWLAWISFAATVALEALWQVRGLPTPHLPALGPQQHAAGVLVAAAALLFTVPMLNASPARATTGAPNTTSTPTSLSAPLTTPTTPTIPTGTGPHVASPETRPAPATAAAPSPSYTVQPGDTLWKVATDHLGDGSRYTEIAHLNYGIAQADGHHLTQAHWLTPGWTLALPASPSNGPRAATAGAERQTVIIQPGDTLWQIAADHLGAGDRYPTIVAASHGQQTDGTHLVDPDLIQPGWELTLPASAAATSPAFPDTAPRDAERPHADRPAAPKVGHGSAENTEHTAVPVLPGPVQAVPAPEASTPTTSAPGTSTPATSASGTSRPATPARQADHLPIVTQAPATTGPVQRKATPTRAAIREPAGDRVTVRTVGGVGALMAASLLTLLGLKRTRQQRRRRPGQRIAMPPPDLQPVELQLRMIQDPTGLARVDQALRSLSVLLAETDQPLPALRLARLVVEALELYLDDATVLPAPFLATGDPTVWTLPPDAPLLPVEQLQQVAAPYPSLITLGHDLQDGHVLIDLEYAATLAVDGDPTASVAVLAAIAAELAISPWADDLQVTVVGCLPQLPNAIGTGRIRHVQTLTELLPGLEHRAATIREILTDSGLPDLQHARSAANQRPHSGAWYPEILLLGGPVDPTERARLNNLLQELPRVSLAAVTATTSTGQATTRTEWTLTLDPNDNRPDSVAVLQPINLALRPQRLDTNDLDQLLDLLAVADQPSQNPHREDPDAPVLITEEPSLVDLEARLLTPAPIHLLRTPHNGKYAQAPTPQGPDSAGASSTAAQFDVTPVGPCEPALTASAVGAAEPGHPDAVEAVGDPKEPVEPEGEFEVQPAPLVQVLGPVTVLHARGRLETDRRNQLTEIAAFIALHPGLDHTHLDEAKWPGARNLTNTRNSAVSKLRRWLGTAADGTEHLPDATGGYRLHPVVQTDWHRWRDLLPEGPAGASTEALAAALELVKGQPFAGVNKRTYAWAERDKQEMISAIGDAAHELARRALLGGDATLARQAAAAGLQADPGAELLWRDALRAEWLAGDLTALNSTADRLIDLASKLGDDLEPETDSLLEELLARTSPRTGTR
jgi:nucleoid-associated protein YgaU